ncbi:unnamed protein product [Bursaphelenchus okinawaensis]|uniref:Uncharacterized protein n=1 Tax=Bursaphelenchus okinawaensis TaxID=465554 RepID=A0A811LGL1_9BILA|nr:unnamed protein product [Bursaphelenchus okinawaensis]CAG9122024.1 unnamed protein product [Bursaphelenchus okinawaensis]
MEKSQLQAENQRLYQTNMTQRSLAEPRNVATELDLDVFKLITDSSITDKIQNRRMQFGVTEVDQLYKDLVNPLRDIP